MRAIGLLSAVCVLLLARPSWGQTGALPPWEENVSGIAEWQPEPMGESATFTVDLRPKLPPIGQQKMNDCQSWALAYMLRSYQEGVDQGWQPDRPERIFSPRFIYNQINKGKDLGGDTAAAALLLRDKGCATLKTCPYVPGDYKGAITPAAFEEAARFKIRAVYQIKETSAFRTALMQGHPLVVCIRVTPEFFAGKFDIYDSALHAKGMAQRKPGQPHAHHAVVLVGFDDMRKAYLMANSWGTGWGQRGYCWVSYEVLEKMEIGKDSTTFAYRAFLLEDIREKVDLNPPDLNSLRIAIDGSHSSFDATKRKNNYRYSAWVTGQSAALDQVTSVRWTAPNLAGQMVNVVSPHRNAVFRINGGASSNDLRFTAVLTLKSGQTRTLNGQRLLPPPSADNRKVELVWRDRYYGKVPVDRVPTNAWWWDTTIEGDMSDIYDIEKVVYNVGPMNRIHPVSECLPNQGGGIRFPHSGLATTPSRITATAFFKDGSRKVLTLDPRFTSPVDDNISIRSSYVDASGGGSASYSFRAWIQFPYGRWTEIDKVVWDYGPTFDHFKREEWYWERNYDVTGLADREFRIKATIIYKSGRRQELDHWVELGPKGKFPDQHRIDLAARDRYEGMVDGHPRWRFTAWLVGDEQTRRRIRSVTYHMPEGYKPQQLEVSPDEAREFALGGLSYQPIRIEAVVRFADGTTAEYSTQLSLQSPRRDAVTIWLSTLPRLDQRSPQALGVRAALAGPSRAVDQIARVRWITPPAAPTAPLVSEADPGSRWTNPFSIYRVFDRGGQIEALLDFKDGSSETHRRVVDSPSYLADITQHQPRIVLRERFLGIDDKGYGQWSLRASLDGPDRLIDTVSKVVWSSRPGASVTNERGWPFPAVSTVNGAGVYRGTVHFKDGTTVDLTEKFDLRCPRPLDPVLLVEGTHTSYEARLAAPPRLLEKVKSIRFTPIGGAETALTADEAVTGRSYSSPRPGDVKARLVFNDGQELELAAAAPSQRPMSISSENRYWGRNLDGEPLWLRVVRLAGPAEQRARVSYVTWKNDPAGGWAWRAADPPDFAWTLILGKPQPVGAEVVMQDNSFTVLPFITPALDRPIQDELTVKVISRRITVQNPSGSREWTAHIEGPEPTLRNVVSVDYMLRFDDTERRHSVASRYGWRHEGFEIATYSPTPPTVEAIVKMADGSTKTLTWAAP